MVNSDQTWNGSPKFINRVLDVGYLKFAENWTIPRFVYGASLGVNYWKFSKKFDNIARQLLKKFSGVSVREIGAIEIVKKHLGINPEYVLDPTLIIDKRYYLDLIKDFNINFNFKEKFLCIYKLDKNILLENLIKNASHLFNYKINKINIFKDKYIENFISCINNSKAVITDSFHGTLFSIIFEKPFIAYLNKKRGSIRFLSLIKTFNLSQRIIGQENFEKVNINLLKVPLYINQSLLNYVLQFLKVYLILKNLNNKEKYESAYIKRIIKIIKIQI
jgi:polysaccharide pyruvyl transferase WcaK-like protein